MRIAVVADEPKGLFRAKQTVGAGEGLDQVLIGQDFIPIECIDPFGVEAGQHLIYHDQKIDLLFRRPFNPHIGLLVRQPQGNIFLI